MPLNHNHVIYPNAVLSDMVEDQYKTKLDMMPFCTIDNSLVGVPGDTIKVNVYRATDGTEILNMGEGNSKNIEVSYAQIPYQIMLAQNRFPYYDEQQMNDPFAVQTGMNHAVVDMLNTVNTFVYGEFAKATQIVRADTPDLAAFVDAVSLLNLETIEGQNIFAFLNPKTMGMVRKAAGASLQYVEPFFRTAYVGTVGSVLLYTSKLIPDGVIVGGTKEAVTVFNKLGTEIEQERDADHRLNKIFSRKYFLVALTNEAKAFKILLGADSASANLTSLQIGSIPMMPAFDPATTTYTATTKQASAKIRAAAEAADATIEITVGETTVENGAQAALEVGENTITVEVTNGNTSKEYTVTVTREATGPQ